jgi:hypothetical protein
MQLKSKKELDYFIANRDEYIEFLIRELNIFGISGQYFNDFQNKIDDIQKYFELEFLKKDINEQDQLRISFWAFFSKLIMDKLGGELIIASKTDYSAGTPLLINYGNKYDKKGKRKWIGIAFDSWLNTLLKGKLFGTLEETVISLIEDYK